MSQSQESLSLSMENVLLDSPMSAMETNSTEIVTYMDLINEMLKDVKKARQPHWKKQIEKLQERMKKKTTTKKDDKILKIMDKLRKRVEKRDITYDDDTEATSLNDTKKHLLNLYEKYKQCNKKTLFTLHYIGKYFKIAKTQCKKGSGNTFTNFKKQMDLPWSVGFIGFSINFFEFTEIYQNLCYCGVSPDFVRRNFKTIKNAIIGNPDEIMFWKD